ncbi:MAG: tail fiber domain-containing protein [Patescibacteria group bacterium]
MRVLMNVRTRIAAAFSALTVLAVAGSVHAQFAAPTCVPPNCNPSVIQNVDIAGAAQAASINISGSQKLGGTFQTGALAPVMSLVTDNLIYGNVGAASTNGSLLLLQNAAADRLRVTLVGQMQLPSGSAGAPSYSYIGDTNTGLYSSGADSMSFVTGGAARTIINNVGTSIITGVLSLPAGTNLAPSLTFSGDTNTGIFRGTADTISFVTNGVTGLTVSATNNVVIPGALTVSGTLTSSGGLTGSGAGLTSMNASQLTSGTVPSGRISGTYSSAVTFNNVANSFTGSGAGLTTLNASNISSGTLADARLSTNVALYNANGTFTGNNALSGMSSLGSAALSVGAGQNLLYGNIDAASVGSLLLLQNESVDEFRVAAGGDTTIGGNLTVTGTITGVVTEADTLQTVAARGRTTTTTIAVGSGAVAADATGIAARATGFGLYGVGTDPTTSYGVYGNGVTAGGRFESGISGYGVMGNANTAVYGVSTGAAGYGGYFTNTAGSFGVFATGGIGIRSQGIGAAGIGADFRSGGTGDSVKIVSPTAGNALNIRNNADSSTVLSVNQAGNLTVAGTGAFTGNLTVAGQSVCRANGVNCPATLGGAGTPNYLAKFTGAGATVGDSQIQDDGSGVAIGGAPTANKLEVYGGVKATTVSAYTIDPNAIVGTSTGAGSTGVSGSGTLYGVYGTAAGSGQGVYGVNTAASGLGKGVHGQGLGGADGVFGESATGWGGHFSSLYVNYNALLVGAVTHNSTLTLGSISSDPGGVNGMTFYNSTSNKFRCYENGAWSDCKPNAWSTINAPSGTDPLPDSAADTLNLAAGAGISVTGDATTDTLTIANTGDASAADDFTGSGTANTLPKFTGATALGNSIIADNAATVTVGGALAVTGGSMLGDATTDRATVNGELVLGSMAAAPTGANGMLYYDTLSNKFKCYENGAWVNCGAEEDTLDAVAARGRQINTYIGVSNTGVAFSALDTAVSVRGTTTGVGVVVNAGGTAVAASGGSTGVNGGGSTYGGYFSGGTYGVYGSGSSYAFYGAGKAYVSGDVGIGWSAPDAKLEVRGGNDLGATGAYPPMKVSQGGADFIAIDANEIQAYSSGAVSTLFMNWNGADTVYGGYVGIGVSDATYQLHLSANSAGKPTSGTWSIISDRRLKDDIQDFTDGLDKIRQLRPVSYRLNGKAGTPKGEEGISLIAQEALPIVPYTIHTFDAKLDPGDIEKTELYDFDSSALTFVLINAAKELDLRIDGLEAEMEDAVSLKRRVDDLERRLRILEEKSR